MADIIKKTIIPAESLTELDWEANGYLVRYRIKSENKNLSSHWSPVYIVPVADFPDVEGSFFETVGEDGQTNVTVVWDDIVERPNYDVFVSFRGLTLFNTFDYDGDTFIYHGTSPTHTYSFVKKSGTESLRIVVQPSADKKIIKSNFVIFDTNYPIEDFPEYS
jgi:hypothetical protein